MAADWPMARVGDLADSISDTHSFGKRELIFLNTSDVLQGVILNHSYSLVEHWPGQAKKSMKKDDILFSEIRPANGRYAYVNMDADDYVASTKLMVIRARNQILPKFLFHYLTSKETTGWLQHLADSRSGTFPQITFDEVADIELRLPPKHIQTVIVEFLDSLDGKIRLNQRMADTLETIARILFKSWFVDFDAVPVISDRKQERNGSLPHGLEMRSLYECANYINGLAFKNEDFSETGEGLPVIKIGELKYGITSQTKFTTKEFDPKYRVTAEDILFSWSGSPDTSIGTFLWTGIDGWLNQHIFKIGVASPEERAFVYFMLRYFNPVFIEVARNKQTTGLGHVTSQDLKRLVTAFPQVEVLRSFNRVADPFLQREYCGRRESRNLALLKAALLPKLMSGEILLKDAKKIVETNA